MIEKIRLGSEVLIEGSSYSIIGIDHYKLINFLMEKKSWESFTISNQTERVSFSITEGKIILWQTSNISLAKKRNLCKKYQLNWNFSGIAQIQFQGDKGVSQPMAELVWLQDKSKIFLFERFFNPDEPDLKIKEYFFTGTIITPEKISII
ncbi:MAG: hypothetical protein BGO76_08990 [Caedibacter sp. 38-128]|nr:hypothetical protein [Holosporales bacterium]OJX07683.1 MAG: hypothetical protein BGO76_08990 [Caedibacter sp. 38-128]